MAEKIEDKIELIKKQFSALPTWEDRYKKLIDMGKKLSIMPDNLKIEENKVKGCQSQVWLYAALNAHGEVVYVADSDALIVKGLVALLLEVYNYSSPEEILRTPPDFLKDLGFESNLSPSRVNGLLAMIKKIKMYATAFDYVLKNPQK